MSDTEDNVRGSGGGEGGQDSYRADSSEDETSEIDPHSKVNARSDGDEVVRESVSSNDEGEDIRSSSIHQHDEREKVEAEKSDSSDTVEEDDVSIDENEDEIIAEKINTNDRGSALKYISDEEERNIDEERALRSPSPDRSPTPEFETHKSPLNAFETSRSSSPERKDSKESEASYSNDERASSLSPEPPKVIPTPSFSSKLSSPSSPPPSSHSPITKIYTEALVDSDGEESFEKVTRHKPATDITQIYTTKLVEKEVESNSPKLERAFKGKAQGVDITQLYTAAFNREGNSPIRNGDAVKPKRNENITKLYTGGFGKGQENGFKAKPTDELTNPKKHNMSTAVDKEAIRDVYNEVMADNNGVEWAAFIFDGPKLGVTAKGDDFEYFKSHFGPDDRGFGYIKIMTGDEMSKRSRFVFCTWVGPNVSVMKKAKMSTDKALMKEIIQNLSVELQIENVNEFSLDNFKAEVDKAGGARYGTGGGDHR